MKTLFLAVLLALTGCATHTVHDVVEKPVQIPVTIPNELLVHCTATAPISVEEYLSLDIKARENALADYTIKLIGDIKLCNAHLDSIKVYQDKVVKSINDAAKDNVK